MKHMHIQRISTYVSALATAALVAACGGGGGAAPPQGGTPVATTSFAVGVASHTAGSTTMTVNGTTFTLSNSTVIRGDDSPRGIDDISDGSVVKVRGRDDNGTRRADEVEIENEVRGAVTAVNAAALPQTFAVGGLTVQVDASTVYANLNPLSFAGIAVGTYVEVHGLRTAATVMRASRVEGQTRNNADPADELKGAISALNLGAKTFALGTVTVNYATATFSPAGTTEAALANSVLVEVHGAFNAAGTVFTAQRVDIEDMEDRGVNPAPGDRVEVEGFVNGLVVAAGGTSGTFTVNGRAVSFSASTQFRNGAVADLANGVRIEVDGTLSGNTLVAREIHFKQARAILAALPSAVNAATRTLTLLGKTVQITDLTDMRTALNLINTTTRIEVRGHADAAGIVIAERVEIDNSGGGRDTVQGVATAKNAAASTLTVLGIPVSLSGAGVQFRDINDQPIDRAAFFTAVTNGQTVVKVRGTAQVGGGGVSINGAEAEIEN